MQRHLCHLCRDDSGLVLSAELIIIVTIVVLGLIVGLAHVQNAVVTEMQGTAAALSSLNQSYGFTGFRGCLKAWGRTSWTAGSTFIDTFGTCVGTGGAMGNFAEIGGGGLYGAPSAPVTTPAPLPMAPEPACPTCVPEAPSAAPCYDCVPQGHSALPTPRLEIPQGPAPQHLPQQ
jgi:hypothetical protein